MMGELYIYLSNENETPVEVFFDDFKVEHIKSPVVQIDDYYPGGATFNSHRRENIVINKRLYQSKEWQTDLSLNLYDIDVRFYDPFIWRTPTIDPHAESYYEWSPYSRAYNNPVRYGDPTGKDPGDKVIGLPLHYSTMPLVALQTPEALLQIMLTMRQTLIWARIWVMSPACLLER